MVLRNGQKRLLLGKYDVITHTAHVNMVSTRTALSSCPMDTYEVESCVRGHHVFGSIWSPTIGEQLVCKRQIGNTRCLCRGRKCVEPLWSAMFPERFLLLFFARDSVYRDNRPFFPLEKSVQCHGSAKVRVLSVLRMRTGEFIGDF